MIRFHRRHREALEDFKRALVELGQRAAMWEGSAKKLDADLRDTKAVLERERKAHEETTAALAAYRVRSERLTALLRQEYVGNEDALCLIQGTADDLDRVSDVLRDAATLLASIRYSFASSDDVAAAIGEAEQ